MSETNDGGLAERGGGGLAQPGGPNTASGGTGGGGGWGGGGGGGGWGQNFSSAYGSPSIGYGSSYGITPFNVPRRDQTLQDRQFGSLGSGMVGTSFGGSGGSNNSSYAGQPAQAPAFRSVKRKNPVTGVVETVSVPVPQPKLPMVDSITGVPIPKERPPQGRYEYGGYPNPSQFNGSNYPDWVGGSWQNITSTNPPGGLGTAGRGYTGFGGGNTPVGFGDGDPPTPGSTSGGGAGAGRQFGGPVAPGGQYTVGENGPETLQMGAQGGQVVPNNPVDRLGGMNPGMMQALFQLMQQQRRPQMSPGQAPVGQPAPQPPQMPQGSGPNYGPAGGPMDQGPHLGNPGGQGGGFRLGDWRSRMGIEGLSRPARQPGMGFGGSGLGMPGIMPQMQRRPGFGG